MKLIGGTPEERAHKLEEVLRCTLRTNELELVRGSYQVVKDSTGEVCQACALGTLACSMGVELKKHCGAGMANRKTILDAVTERSKYLTRGEAIQMELGFEDVREERSAGATYAGTAPDMASPFYKLGERLSKSTVLRKRGFGYFSV